MRSGPGLALLVSVALALQVLYWNSQQHWVTVTHVAGIAGAGKPWIPTVRFMGDFLAGEFGLLNPVFFVAAVWAACAFWRRNRQNPRLVYFFSMGAPLFLVHFLYSSRSRILLNWIAPSVLPLFCVMVIYWEARLRLGAALVKRWLIAGL